MAFRFMAFATLLAYAHAGFLPAAAPVAYAAAPAPLTYAAPVAKAVVAQAEEYDPNPQYSYGYDVQDGLTGDSKSHSESRNGDVVQGSYSLVDADGTRRTVEYTADPIHGFNAVVHKEPLAVASYAAAPIAKVATPVAYAAPIAKVAAPVGYAAPLNYGSPVARIAAPLAYSAPAAYASHPGLTRISYASPAIHYSH